MSIDLGQGLTVEVDQPHSPTVTVTPPTAADVLVLPIAGPPGPQGPAGDVETAGFQHSQSAPAALWQITHLLGFRPGGITVLDTLGVLVEPDRITWPTADIVEITFGAPVAGVAYLS